MTRKSDDGGRALPRALKIAVELGLFFRGAGRSVMPGVRVIVTDLSHLGVGLNGRGDFRGRFGLLCRASPVGPARTM